MPYREKKIYCGDLLYIEIYPITKKEKNMSRKKKLKQSKLSQKNLNDKNAKKHLIRLINNNFTNDDLAVHLTYSDDNLPENEEAAKKDVVNYIRRLKNYRRKNNLPELKYIAVIEGCNQEGDKKGSRIHHHIIINDMDRDIVERLWKKGRANADRLKADEFGYEGLARYMSKDPRGAKRWAQSKNLKQPRPLINDHEFTGRKAENLIKSQERIEKQYKNYRLLQCESDINDMNGGLYVYIKMRKIEEETKKYKARKRRG